MNELSINVLNELTINGLNELSIDVLLCDLLGINELYSICLNELSFNVSFCNIHVMIELSINVFPRDVRESRDVTSESEIHGLNILNVIGQKLALNGLNGLDVLGVEST